MNPIYLSRVQIANFRSYGEIDVELSGGPGLTVLCGMNGLGKTTFFEAIEWALLGDVQRLPMKGALTRKGAAPGSHRVTLGWGNETITRGKRSTPSAAEMEKLLRSPDWAPRIHDLAAYIRLTHLLPQSSRTRFLGQDKTDQWSLLEGPAGVERVERLRFMLDDVNARKAFERRISMLHVELDNLQERHTEWRNLLAERDEWTKLAGATNLVTPDTLARRLGEIDPSLYDPVPRGKLTQVDSISVIRRSIEARRGLAQDRERALTILLEVVRRFKNVQERLAAINRAVADAPNEENILTDKHRQAKEEVAGFEARARSLADKKAETSRDALALLMLIEAEAKRAEAEKTLRQLGERLKGQGSQLQAVMDERKVRRAQVDAHKVAATKVKIAESRVREVEQATKIWEGATAAVREYDQLAAQVPALKERGAAHEQERKSTEQLIRETELQLQEAQTNLRMEQAALNQSVGALSHIISRVGPNDTICPVCAHVHPPGDLARRAQGSLGRYDQVSARLVKIVGELEGKLAEARRKSQSLLEAHRLLNEELAAINEKHALALAKREELAKHPIFAGVALEAAADILKEKQGRLGAARDAAQKELTQIAAPDEFAASELEIKENSLRAEIAHLIAEEGKTRKTAEEAASKLAAADLLIAREGGLPNLAEARQSHLRAIADAENVLRDTHAQLLDAQNREANVKRLLQQQMAKRDADRRSQVELQMESESLLREWRKAELEAEPNELAVVKRQAALREMESRYAKALDEIRLIAGGVEAWTSRERLQKIEQQISAWQAQQNVTTSEECTRALGRHVEAKRKELGQAELARKRAGEIAQSLKSASETFSQTALRPLSARISAFNRVISPYQYEVKIEPHLTGTRTRTSPSIVVPGLTSNRTEDRDPDAWLSDGQMSAMGLSVLLGASTVYRWSRWKALLLDDPLQNTDLIHAAAFGDVIRSLMRIEKFQVIVSTHDHEEADFLIRKCRRADLPVRRIELLSAGNEGVRFNLRDR